MGEGGEQDLRAEYTLGDVLRAVHLHCLGYRQYVYTVKYSSAGWEEGFIVSRRIFATFL
jgi:hypothetical protein